MFGTLTTKLQEVLGKLTRQKQLTESNLVEAVREVRMALLEADVQYSVASALVTRIKEKALGAQVLKSMTPGQQFIGVVHDELVALMGGEEVQLKLKGQPTVIMLCGLQGCGKTTTAGKLAQWLKKQGRRPMLVACDLQRPAAVQQLRVLAQQVGVPVVADETARDPEQIAKRGLEEARAQQCDVVILDTAGRLHIDAPLMEELLRLKKQLNPSEVILVASAAQGQDALTTATAFHEQLGLTGSIVTMLDGTARAGVAVSLREVTQKPIYFEGMGERVEDLRPFHPTSMAQRILGMGDAINLSRMAKSHFDEEQSASLEEKVKKGAVTYDDFLAQTELIEKLGSMRGLLKMLPAQLMGGLSADQLLKGEATFKKYRAIVRSMTRHERAEQVELDMPRRRRIAKGSGTSLDEVNQLVKSFKQLKQFLKQMPNINVLGKLMGGGAKWL
ncbi:MAG: signal recognition particle protein [Chlamydiia bacterium]